MTPIITIGIHSSGTRRTYRSPARTWPFARAAGAGVRSSAGRIIKKAAITGMYDSPSSRKHQP